VLSFINRPSGLHAGFDAGRRRAEAGAAGDDA